MTKGALDHQAEQHDDDDDAGEAQLFGDHREQKIGMRFGQVEEFFDTGTKADAEQFAATEGDQRMRQLIAATEGVVRPRVHEAEDAIAPVGRDDDQRGEGGDQNEDQDGEQPRAHAAEEQDADGDRNDHHEGTEVGFLEQQHADHHHRPGHRQEGLAQLMHVRHLAHRVIGGVRARRRVS